MKLLSSAISPAKILVLLLTIGPTFAKHNDLRRRDLPQVLEGTSHGDKRCKSDNQYEIFLVGHGWLTMPMGGGTKCCPGADGKTIMIKPQGVQCPGVLSAATGAGTIIATETTASTSSAMTGDQRCTASLAEYEEFYHGKWNVRQTAEGTKCCPHLSGEKRIIQQFLNAECPSNMPSLEPSSTPSAVPTSKPSSTPSASPTSKPSSTPSAIPTSKPSSTPSAVPTSKPSSTPSAVPTANPSASPTSAPSSFPSEIDWRQLGSTIEGNELDQAGYSVALSRDGSTLAVGAIDAISENTLVRTGNVKVYRLDSNKNWVKIGQTINGLNEDDMLGFSVSLSKNGSTLAVGAILFDHKGVKNNVGRVRVFRENPISGNWNKIGNNIRGESEDDESGYSVSLSDDGNIVAIGAIYNDGSAENSGHVRVFRILADNVWTKIGDDIDGLAKNDRFGNSVDLSSDGSIVAIGAQLNDDVQLNSGHVRVFGRKLNPTTGIEAWIQMGSNIVGSGEGDRFGTSVSLSSNGKKVAIASIIKNGPGQVRVLKFVPDGVGGFDWSQIGGLITGEGDDDASNAVALSSDGKTVAVGAKLNDGLYKNGGHVRVYNRNTGVWRQIGSDIEGENKKDQSGSAISLSGDGMTVAVGANLNDDNGENSGQVRVFSYPENF